MTEPAEGDRADRNAQPKLDPADREDLARAVDDPERRGIKERRRADQHRGQSDKAVKGSHQLRHRGHLDAPRGDEPDRPADGDRDGDLSDRGDVVDRKRRRDGDRHARHAEAVAALAGGGARQPAQGEDEAHPRDEIGDHDPRRDGGRGIMHRCDPSSCTSPASAP